jgi:peptidoglycan-N-acetylglucosamine deacetylase
MGPTQLSFVITFLMASIFAACSSPSRRPQSETVETSPTASACRYATNTSDLPDKPVNKKITLTFDDGPSEETTPKVLDILKKYHIKATFFIIGENVDGKKSIIKREIAEGHRIGNHTFTHPHLNELKGSAIENEISKTEKLLRPFQSKNPLLIRFPYGDSSCEAQAIAESKNLRIIGWHVDSCDWSYGDGLPDGSCLFDNQPEDSTLTSDELYERFAHDSQGWLDYQLEHTHGGIVLMHDIQQYTVDHLEGLIQHWISQGYQFDTLDSGDYPNLMSGPAPAP